MAYITGTAASHTALWNTLLDFLQNNVDLVAAGQNWTVAWQHATRPNEELVLQGPGLSGTDEIYVGLYRVDEANAIGESEIYIAGMTGVIDSAERYTGHVNVLPRVPRIFLDFSPMQYWMVANGRRFVVIVKISTVYQALYGGFFLPYGSPTAYPYPLFIGGTVGNTTQSADERITSWREGAHPTYRQFVCSSPDTASSPIWHDGTAYLLDPAGVWRVGTIDPYNDVPYNIPGFLIGPRAFPRYLGATQLRSMYTPNYNYGNECLGYDDLRALITPGLNGEMPMMPITLHSAMNSTSPQPVSYGVLDGCFSVAGDSNYAENVITVDGVNHLTVQDVMRTTAYDYWALTLE